MSVYVNPISRRRWVELEKRVIEPDDSRRLVSCQLQELHFDLTTWVDREYPCTWYVDTPIRQCIRDPVSKARVKRGPWTFAKEPLNISKASHLKHLGFAHDDFAVVR